MSYLSLTGRINPNPEEVFGLMTFFCKEQKDLVVCECMHGVMMFFKINEIVAYAFVLSMSMMYECNVCTY